MKKIKLLVIALIAGLAVAATFPMNHSNRSSDEVIFVDAEGKKFDEVLSQFKGKVVYVDFWASWCGPCIGQMRYSDKLHKQYEGKEVAFLYISLDRSEQAWKKGIKKHGISGYHWKPNQKQIGEIMKKFKVRTIPRYMLVSKKGEVLNDDFLRPSSKRLPQYLNKALELK